MSTNDDIDTPLLVEGIPARALDSEVPNVEEKEATGNETLRLSKTASDTSSGKKHKKVLGGLLALTAICYLICYGVLPHGGGRPGEVKRAILFDKDEQKWVSVFWAPAAHYMEWRGQAQVVDSRFDEPLTTDIEEVQFWGLGSPQGVWYGGRPLSVNSFVSLLNTTGTLPVPGGVIWLKTSYISNDYASKLAIQSLCHVVCYSRNTHLLQSHAKGFAPGDGRLTTPDDEDIVFQPSMPWDARMNLCTLMKLPAGILNDSK